MVQAFSDITVAFIDDLSGEVIGTSVLPSDQLPQTFSCATTLRLEDENWSVVTATPQHADEFMQTGSLELRLRKIVFAKPDDIRYSMPTIANVLPITGADTDYQDFEISLDDDDWRQREFVIKEDLPKVLEDMLKIRCIWEHESQQVEEHFYTFNCMHVRTNIAQPRLQLPFDTLQSFLKTDEIGSLMLNGHGYVKNGFSLESAAAVYYGVVEDGMVQTLGIKHASDKAPKEIEALTRQFNLLFVDWCNCNIWPDCAAGTATP